MMQRLARSLLALLAIAAPVAAGAQAPEARAGSSTIVSAHATAVPSASAVRRSGPVVLDAALDEAAWRSATPITEFRQVDPDQGAAASQRTEVRFLFDDDALYVGARMYDTAGARGVVTRLVRRDGTFDSDYLELVIDAYHDHLSRAFFDVNPSGAKGDYIGIGASCCDGSWDPIWEAATRIDENGWTAEIRIPYSQLRFSRDSVQTWGLQVRRFIKRRDEQDQWSWWGKTESGGPARFGHLRGIRPGASRARLELLPYVLSKSSSRPVAGNDPFDSRGRPTLRAGLDLKERLTTNLTLDATINPDFGQVEVDPAVLNLSAFETFFPEKRPFFVEGSQVFDFGTFGCHFCSNVEAMNGFYSRRIGRAPSGADLATQGYAWADVPDATTILGAGKITGRTADGLTVGLLNAVTGRATARVQSASGERGTQEVEPLANYFVGRVKQDLDAGNLVVGGMLSGVARDLDSTFAPRLARHAEMLGGDLFYMFGRRAYSVRASAALTNVSGDARAIALRQRSSARYFQRPDRGAGSGGVLSNRYDPTATSLRGAGAYLRVAKDAGNTIWELQATTRSPGYESNDYAFQLFGDYTMYIGNYAYIWRKPTRWYRDVSVLAGGETQFNYEGDRTWSQVHEYLGITTPGFWTASVFHIYRPSAVDDRLLRGGPVVATPGNHFLSGNLATDRRHAWVGNLNASYSRDTRGGTSQSLSVTAEYRPASNVSLSFGPSFNGSRGSPQFVESVNDPTATTFYGARYVMADLDQRTVGLDTRLSVTFSPTMTLEMYVQPFFAAGRYTHFEEFARPRTSHLLVYGRDAGAITGRRDSTGRVASYTVDPDGDGPATPFTVENPDFTQESLRGNAVFRWEYRPGSVLYVAWTQSRAGDQPLGDMNLWRDRTALLSTRPTNVVLVKASWWIG